MTAFCGGGLAAREAKAWLPSAWRWAVDRPKDHAYSIRLLKQSVRQPDPYYTLDGWKGRAPDRPALWKDRTGTIPKAPRRAPYPERYGAPDGENLHLATSDQRTKILRALTERKADWLVKAAHAMSKATEQDWETFRSSHLRPEANPCASLPLYLPAKAVTVANSISLVE